MLVLNLSHLSALAMVLVNKRASNKQSTKFWTVSTDNPIVDISKSINSANACGNIVVWPPVIPPATRPDEVVGEPPKTAGWKLQEKANRVRFCGSLLENVHSPPEPESRAILDFPALPGGTTHDPNAEGSNEQGPFSQFTKVIETKRTERVAN
jgi:hypothetical protein